MQFILGSHRQKLYASFDPEARGFAPPLTKQQEHDCFVSLANGDDEAKELLVEHNMRLVAHCARRYNGLIDADEMLSIGSVGLLKAINTFNVERGTQFSTYAAKCIENEILMYLRANKNNRINISLFQTVGVDKEGNEVALIDTLYNEQDEVGQAVERNDTVDMLHRVLNNALTPRDKRIIILRYGLFGHVRLPQRMIADREGISRSYISRLEKKALAKMKQYMIDNRLDDR